LTLRSRNAVPVEPQKDDVEKHAKRPPQPVIRHAKWTLDAPDGNLGDAGASQPGQSRHESVLVAEQPKPLHQIGPVRPERRPEVMNGQVDDVLEHDVRNPRGPPPDNALRPVHTPSAHQIVSLTDCIAQSLW